MRTIVRIKCFGVASFAAAIMAAAALSTGCIVDQHELGLDALTTFTAELPPAQTVSTRAVGNANENMIGTLSVLLFQAGGGYIETIDCSHLTPSENNNSWTFRARIPFSATPYDLLFVANVRSMPTLTAGMSRGQVQAQLVQNKTDKWTVDSSGSIPMFGELKNQTVDEDYNPEADGQTLDMRRMLARVNVEVAQTAQPKFSLTDVYVYNYNTRGNVIPGASDPSVPAGTNRVTTALSYTPNSSWASTDQIYLFENTVGVLYPTANWADSPCIVVGGKFDGSQTTTWYRLDFINSGSVATPVVRNTSYNFSINSVSGAGYASADIARNSPPANMTADILSWDDADFGNILIGTIYDITIATTTGGTALANNKRAYAGMPIKATATPATGYQFVNWTTSPADLPINGSTDNPAQEFPMPASDVTITPVFSIIPYIKVETNALAFGAASDLAYSVKVYSNVAWSASVSSPSGNPFSIDTPAAAVPDPGKAERMTTMNISATAFTGDQRTGRVTITTTGVTPVATATIDLIQSAFVPELTLAAAGNVDSKTWAPTESGEGAALLMTVTANTSWSVTPPTGFSVSPGAGSGNGSFTIYPSGTNTTAADKEGVVTVTTTAGAPDVTASFPVRQVAPYLNLSPGSLAPWAADGTDLQRIDIVSNIPWQITNNATGNFNSPTTGTSGTGNGSFNVQPASANSTPDARTATITVVGTGDFEAISKALNVTQLGLGTAAKFAASVARNPTSGGTVTVEGVAGPVDVKPGVGVSFSATPATGWIFNGWQYTTASATAPFGYISGSGTGTNPLTVAMPAEPLTMTAIFTQPTYTLTTAKSPTTISGAITVSPSDAQPADTEITLTAPAAPSEYEFTGWTLSGLTLATGSVATNLTIKVKMPANNDGLATANYEPLLKAGDPVEIPMGGSTTLIVAGTNLMKPNDESWGSTTNVFAAHATDYGDIYQWGWDNALPWENGTGNGWKTSGTSGKQSGQWNPCPQEGGLATGKNWRLPTDAELRNLISTTYTTVQFVPQAGSVDAYFLIYAKADTNKSNPILLPAAGYRNGSTGNTNSRGTNGLYWSSVENITAAYRLLFYSGSPTGNVSYLTQRNGYSVRCVRTK